MKSMLSRALCVAIVVCVCLGTQRAQAYSSVEHDLIGCWAIVDACARVLAEPDGEPGLRSALQSVVCDQGCAVAVKVGSPGKDVREKFIQFSGHAPDTSSCAPLDSRADAVSVALSVAFEHSDYCETVGQVYGFYHDRAMQKALEAWSLQRDDAQKERAHERLQDAIEDELMALHFYADMFTPEHIIARPSTLTSSMLSSRTVKLHLRYSSALMKNSLQQRWMSYGDLLGDHRNADNARRLRAGAMASMRSIFQAFMTGARESTYSEYAKVITPACYDEEQARMAVHSLERPSKHIVRFLSGGVDFMLGGAPVIGDFQVLTYGYSVHKFTPLVGLAVTSNGDLAFTLSAEYLLWQHFFKRPLSIDLSAGMTPARIHTARQPYDGLDLYMLATFDITPDESLTLSPFARANSVVRPDDSGRFHVGYGPSIGMSFKFDLVSLNRTRRPASPTTTRQPDPADPLAISF